MRLPTLRWRRNDWVTADEARTMVKYGVSLHALREAEKAVGEMLEDYEL